MENLDYLEKKGKFSWKDLEYLKKSKFSREEDTHRSRKRIFLNEAI